MGITSNVIIITQDTVHCLDEKMPRFTSESGLQCEYYSDVQGKKLSLQMLKQDNLAYEFAVTQSALKILLSNQFNRELARNILNRTRVFCEVSPLKKAWVIKKLKQHGYYIGICSDGVGDIPTLKVSLSS
jgi:magnesium-transporting ATPase (P-type)